MDSPSKYHVTQLNAIAGGYAAGISDNDQGWVSGYSLTASNAVHAALWRERSSAGDDLGTLGGANSAVEWPNHTPGQVIGIAQLAQTDPLGEQWSCTYPAGGGFIPYTGQECHGFRWVNDRMHDLETLGGNNSFAAGSNVLGTAVGWAETSVHDDTCVSPQVLQFKGALWTRDGRPYILRPLSGDPDSAATAINDRGVAVGISGICGTAVGARSAKHMVMWRFGVPTQLPDLGGSAWNTPEMINDENEVVGFSDLPGDNNGANPDPHAFRWTQTGGTQNLGTLPGDSASYAYSVNNRGIIVGQSCTPGCAQFRAFVYVGGKMYDLNQLLDLSGKNLQLAFANDINDQGEITGAAINTATNEVVAFRLTPTVGCSAQVASRARTARNTTVSNYRLHIGPFGRMIPAF